jgi:hypothetical protein
MKGIDFILYSLTGRPWKFQVKSSDTGVYACIKKTREYQKKNSGRAGFVTVINGNWEEDYLRDYVLKRMYG